ncbi:MAG: ParA family protein [Proteobacteria bacterium]|nr:ParA family protein [Pseudomonadota bacterium]MBU1715000.1 ParA family protein [Pseudomonadota bacterium]
MEEREQEQNDLKYFITVAELGNLLGISTAEVARDLQKMGLDEFIPGSRKGLRPGQARNYLTAKGTKYESTVVAHINMKGGIGKTTTTITTATRAAQYGFKTCILDLDPQASSSLAFDKMPEDGDPIFCDVWQNPASILINSLKKIQEDLYILPSSLENSLLDLSLINPGSQKNAVKGVCAELQKHGFDLVLIDCPPSLGTAVISSICAADVIIIPVGSDAFSIKGLELTLNEISSISDTFNLPLPRIKILYTKFDKREAITTDTLQRLSKNYPDFLFPVAIRTSTDFSKALARRETVFASGRKSSGKEDYDIYVRHLLGMPRPKQTRKANGRK